MATNSVDSHHPIHRHKNNLVQKLTKAVSERFIHKAHSSRKNFYSTTTTSPATQEEAKTKSTKMGNNVCIEDKEDEKPGVMTLSAAGHDDIAASISADSSSTTKHRLFKGPATAAVAQFVVGVASKIGHAVEHLLLVVEDRDHRSSIPSPRPRILQGGVLLYGCDTPEEHFARHDYILEVLKDLNLRGEEGLQAVGLELRHVACPLHQSESTCTNGDVNKNKEKEFDEEAAPEHDDSSISESSQPGESEEVAEHTNDAQQQQQYCDDCMTRLFHRESNIMVEDHNRKQFVSDGPMYDEVARLCMECAHESIIKEGDLQWVKIEDHEKGSIHALVSSTHPAVAGDVDVDMTRPTVLVVTGKGKVRAGIFSRQHIISTGLEPSTGLFIIREAKRRNMNVVMLDPNVLGEREAYYVVKKSMAKLFSHIENNSKGEAQDYPLFLQAHSAAGSHMVRYLLDHSEVYLPHLRAVAFTDSTHNIQWARNLPELSQFLESPAAVYFRSTKNNRDDYCHVTTAHDAGSDVGHHHRDEHWIRRFGNIRTRWAGTTEHSLSDWNARAFIWEHFDQHTKQQ